MGWMRTWGRMTAVGTAAAADQAMMQHLAREAAWEVRMALREAGWTERDLAHPSAPEITLAVTRDHADYWTRNLIALLAEARALDLRTAPLLPEKMPLWRWRRKLR